jgi:hypothetical protein
MFRLEADGELYNSMLSGILNPESWMENTGDVDNWALNKKENGNWEWEPDDSLNFNFNLGNEEIRKALFASTSFLRTNSKLSLDLSKMKINGDVGTIAFEDMEMEEMAKLGFNLGIRDPDGTKYLSKPGDPPGNVAFSIFMKQTQEKLDESVNRGNAINEYRSNTLQLKANGVKYKFGGGDLDKNGIVLGSSATMDCSALVSYLTQTKKYGTSIFGVNPAFETTSVPMPGDVFVYLATNAEGGSESHAIIWLGGNEAVDSAIDKGPRTTTFNGTENYYNNNSITFTRQAYKLKKR